MTAPALLELHDVVAGYGPVTVLNGLSLAVAPQERLAVIGRNGVGKTTALRAVMGLAALRSGRIVFDGQDLARLVPHQRAELGAHVHPATRRRRGRRAQVRQHELRRAALERQLVGQHLEEHAAERV